MVEKQKVWSIILRIGAAAIAVVLAGLILFFANGIVGNPISKAIATNKVEKYLEGVYPGSTIDDVSFSFDGGVYIFACTIDGEQRNIYFKRKITDKYVAEHFEDQFNMIYKRICKSYGTLDLINSFGYIETRINATGSYSEDYEKLPLSHYLNLHIINTDPFILESDSQEMAAKILVKILDEFDKNGNVYFIYINYIDKFGEYEIRMQDETFTFEKLLENTKVDLFINSVNETTA